jgi:hypothetical protein
MILTRKFVEDYKRESVVKLYQAGIGVMRLAQITGWSTNKITRILRRANIEVERRGNASKLQI